MESELVAGLCELWLNFFLKLNLQVLIAKHRRPRNLISKYIVQVAVSHLDVYRAHLNKGLNTIFWVLGLIQYRNNNLYNIIGIVSDLYCTLIKYVDKIINPSNGNFCYKKGYYNLNYPSSHPINSWGLGINTPSGYIPMVY